MQTAFPQSEMHTGLLDAENEEKEFEEKWNLLADN